MQALMLDGFFSVGGGGYYLLILVFLALLVGLYVWGSSRNRSSEPGDATKEEFAYLDEEKLTATPDDRLVKAVAANLINKLDERRPNAYATIPQLSHGRCMVYSIWLICHELDEGGFEELFASPSGEFTELAADAMEELGAGKCAQALREALNAEPEALAELHADFLEGVEEEDPLDRCVGYIRDNVAEFVDPAEEDPSHYSTLNIE